MILPRQTMERLYCGPMIPSFCSSLSIQINWNRNYLAQLFSARSKLLVAWVVITLDRLIPAIPRRP